MHVAVEEEMIFELFAMLPPEIKLMNDITSREMKPSKNHIYALEFCIDDRDHNVQIYIVLNEFDEREGRRGSGFRLSFETNFDNTKAIEYYSLRGKQYWQIDLDISTDLIQCGMDHFRTLLQLHQNGIQMLNIEGAAYKRRNRDIQFGVESLRNLEKLLITCDGADAQQFFDKIQHPLKKLVVHGSDNNKITADFETIYQVRDRLEVRSLRLNWQQISRLIAKRVCVSIATFTPQEIFNYVETWRNGQYNGTIDKIEWWIDDSIFDMKLFCRLFRVPETDFNIFQLPRKCKIEVKQRGTFQNADLVFDRLSIRFTMRNEELYDRSGDEEGSDEDEEEEEEEEDEEDEEEEEEEERMGDIVERVDVN